MFKKKKPVVTQEEFHQALLRIDQLETAIQNDVVKRDECVLITDAIKTVHDAETELEDRLDKVEQQLRREQKRRKTRRYTGCLARNRSRCYLAIKVHTIRSHPRG